MTPRVLVTSMTASFGLLIGGCTITFPQVDSVVDLVQAELDAAENGERMEDRRWIASYNGTGRLMTPYLQGDLTLFISDEGDAIAFDGWLVRSLGGFGQEKIISVNDANDQRVYTSGLFRTVGVCGSWTQNAAADNGIIWSQICENPGAKNTLRLNEAGLIVEIDQVIDRSGWRVILRKL